MDVKDKVAIITGGGTGQGREAALLFADAGARVVVAEWNEETGNRTAQDINNCGFTAEFMHTDVSNEQSVRETVHRTLDRFARIDILYNNAGIGYSAGKKYKMAGLLDTPLQDWNSILGINLNGVFLMSREVLPHMIAHKSGCIINTSSVNGLLGVSGADAYTAAKGGVIALTRVMAVDFAKYGIRVNCIAPGAIDTPMIAPVLAQQEARDAFEKTPLGRVGRADEIAQVALFLASEASSYMTGQVLAVDGGWTAI